MKDLSESMTSSFVANLDSYLESHSLHRVVYFYLRPSALEDSKTRQAIRLALLAARVANAVGYSSYVFMIKAALRYLKTM